MVCEKMLLLFGDLNFLSAARAFTTKRWWRCTYKKRQGLFVYSRRLHKIHYKLSTPLLYPLQCVLVKFNTPLLYYEENAWSAFESRENWIRVRAACREAGVVFVLHQAHSATSDLHKYLQRAKCNLVMAEDTICVMSHKKYAHIYICSIYCFKALWIVVCGGKRCCQT